MRGQGDSFMDPEKKTLEARKMQERSSTVVHICQGFNFPAHFTTKCMLSTLFVTLKLTGK